MRKWIPEVPTIEVCGLLAFFVVLCFIPAFQEICRQRANDAKERAWSEATAKDLKEQFNAGKIFRPEQTEFFAIKLF